jgi:hypothetical protein
MDADRGDIRWSAGWAGCLDSGMTSSLPAGYEISTDPSRLDAELIFQWLSLDSY